MYIAFNTTHIFNENLVVSSGNQTHISFVMGQLAVFQFIRSRKLHVSTVCIHVDAFEVKNNIWVHNQVQSFKDLKAPKSVFSGFFAIAEVAIHCDGSILNSFVFPQFTSFHSVFHSFHGLMNSINWPVSSIWVFIAQAGRALQS